MRSITSRCASAASGLVAGRGVDGLLEGLARLNGALMVVWASTTGVL